MYCSQNNFEYQCNMYTNKDIKTEKNENKKNNFQS